MNFFLANRTNLKDWETHLRVTSIIRLEEITICHRPGIKSQAPAANHFRVIVLVTRHSLTVNSLENGVRASRTTGWIHLIPSWCKSWVVDSEEACIARVCIA